jgi:AraC-like DNA-binding protein
MKRRLTDILLRTIIPAAGKIKPVQVITGQSGHPRQTGQMPSAPGVIESMVSHYHNMPEFCWCLSGRCAMQVGANYYLVKAGDLCLMDRNTLHFESFRTLSENYEIVWFIFPTVAECLIVHCAYRNRKYQQLQSLHFSIQRDMVRYMDTMLEQDRPQTALVAGVRKLFTLFAQYLRDPVVRKQEYIFTDKRKSNFQLRKVMRAQEYIQEHYAEKLSLEQVSRVAGFNPAYFARLFHQINRRTYVDYVTQIRLQQAQRFMNETLLTISEISYRVGFNDFYYFSRLFKKCYGLSPRQFRDKYIPVDLASLRREKKLRKQMTDDRVVY